MQIDEKLKDQLEALRRLPQNRLTFDGKNKSGKDKSAKCDVKGKGNNGYGNGGNDGSPNGKQDRTR